MTINDEWRRSFWARLAALEKKYGKGPTYGLRDRQLILVKIVPEWVFRAAYAGETVKIRQRAERAAIALERLYTEAFGEPEAP
jgi:hypothetical protein